MATVQPSYADDVFRRVGWIVQPQRSGQPQIPIVLSWGPGRALFACYFIGVSPHARGAGVRAAEGGCMGEFGSRSCSATAYTPSTIILYTLYGIVPRYLLTSPRAYSRVLH